MLAPLPKRQQQVKDLIFYHFCFQVRRSCYHLYVEDAIRRQQRQGRQLM
jgi:hypothetical protein